MTEPKLVRNVYCTDPEDLVIEHSCRCCKRCWLFVQSKQGRRNGMCVFGGPYSGYLSPPSASTSEISKSSSATPS